jgi:predicted DNA-binding transcriptional regulator AlpA
MSDSGTDLGAGVAVAAPKRQARARLLWDKPGALALDDAAAYVSLSPSSWQRKVQRGEAPKPRQLDRRRVGWLVSELDDWLAGLPVSTIEPGPGRRAA